MYHWTYYRCIMHSVTLALMLLTCSGRIAAWPAAGNRPAMLQQQATGADQAQSNRSSLFVLESELLMWVEWVGHLQHTVFDKAQNLLIPQSVLFVNQLGLAGQFASVQAAIGAVPVYNDRRVYIIIAPGVYREKIVVPSSKPYITMWGGGCDNTILEWNDTADTIGPSGVRLSTYGSASVAVEARYFIARNITFMNTAPIPASGDEGKQAVALRITGDTAAFYGCNFVGGQDTLYDHMGRHYFKDCYIEGSVDFIFGDGLSLYEGCHLHAISETTYGSVAAHKRGNVSENTGFSFLNCRITGSGLVYLGRAWGSYARVVYAYTYMDDIIVPEGWSNWNDPQRDQTVVFGQYKCSGPGANQTGRVTWSRELTDLEALPFLTLSYVDGDEWLLLDSTLC